MCGGTQNMTAYTYVNNLAGNISFTRSKKQTNILKVAKCLSLPAYAEHFSKCKTGESIFSKILWPVNLSEFKLCHLYNCIVPKL